MKPVTAIDATLRVTSVRSRGSFGGVIFVGRDDGGSTFVVKADFNLVPDASVVEVAQLWRVTGPIQEVSYLLEGIRRTESQVAPQQLEMLRPSGKHLVDWIANSPDCRGIGEVRARRLYDHFGDGLIPLIEEGNIDRLSEVVDATAAESLIAAFAKHGVAHTLSWLDQLGLPRALGAAVVRYWGRDARARVEDNPYVLVSFCADWKTVDSLAQSRFGVHTDDARRLISAAEDALYRTMDSGSTATSVQDAVGRVARLLGGATVAHDAIKAAVAAGKLVESNGLLQAAGLCYVEGFIARALSAMLQGATLDQSELFEVDLPSEEFARAHLAVYEASQGIELTPEQRAAVLTSATQRFSLILGGAGTGKTTVLKALCHVIEQASPGAEIHQFALAGRAAQRMSQSTGRQASTIAAFLSGMSVAPGSTVLVDEVSMVDALLMYRLLKELPPGVRLVLIGDPAQLPPIGPGLVLHALEGASAIPQTTLTTVKRQSSASGIPQVAKAVRQHDIPKWAPYVGQGGGVSVVECVEADLDETVARIYAELGGDATNFDVQILSVTRNGPGGVKNLNGLIHGRFAPKHAPVLVPHHEYGLLPERTDDMLGLFVGDLVMYGANDYTLGLRNGSLGVVVEARAWGTPAASEMALGQQPAEVVCIVEFEGNRFELTASHLRHIRHAYAITTHKSQGSQFDRVILPIRQSKLLDNALLYTAITRAVSQVVIVGDISAATNAIRADSHSARRVTRLRGLLTRSGSPSVAQAEDRSSAPSFCP